MRKNLQKKILKSFLTRSKKKFSGSFFKKNKTFSSKDKIKKASWKKINFFIPEPTQPPAPPIQSPAQLVIQAPVSVPAQIQVQPQKFLMIKELIYADEPLKDQIEGFLLDQSSPHTQRAYAKDLKRFFKFLVVRKNINSEQALNRELIVAYKDYLLKENLQHTTIDRHLATLRSFFEWLVEGGILEKNPAKGVRFLKPKRLSTTEGFTDDEVRKMLSGPNLHSRVGALHYAVLMVLFFCGLRRSELTQIRTSHLSVERGLRVLRVKGKGNQERIITLLPQVWNALAYYLRITRKIPGTDQWLFTAARRVTPQTEVKPIDSSMVFHIVRRYAKLAGIEKRVSPHSCRATAISNARDRKVPDRAIQEFAGWASPDMITRYDKRKSLVTESAALYIDYGDQELSRTFFQVTQTGITENQS